MRGRPLVLCIYRHTKNGVARRVSSIGRIECQYKSGRIGKKILPAKTHPAVCIILPALRIARLTTSVPCTDGLRLGPQTTAGSGRERNRLAHVAEAGSCKLGGLTPAPGEGRREGVPARQTLSGGLGSVL